MRKEYIYPICDLMTVEEDLLVPGSIKNPSGVVTETPEDKGDIIGPFPGPDIENPGDGDDILLD